MISNHAVEKDWPLIAKFAEMLIRVDEDGKIASMSPMISTRSESPLSLSENQLSSPAMSRPWLVKGYFETLLALLRNSGEGDETEAQLLSNILHRCEQCALGLVRSRMYNNSINITINDTSKSNPDVFNQSESKNETPTERETEREIHFDMRDDRIDSNANPLKIEQVNIDNISKIDNIVNEVNAEEEEDHDDDHLDPSALNPPVIMSPDIEFVQFDTLLPLPLGVYFAYMSAIDSCFVSGSKKAKKLIYDEIKRYFTEIFFFIPLP